MGNKIYVVTHRFHLGTNHYLKNKINKQYSNKNKVMYLYKNFKYFLRKRLSSNKIIEQKFLWCLELGT